jgi:hypothetical protein
MLFGVSSKKVFLRGIIPSPKIFEGRFTCKSKKSKNFSTVRDTRKIPTTNQYQIGVKESNDVVISLLALLVAEIIIPPFLARGKALITLKRYKNYGKCQ